MIINDENSSNDEIDSLPLLKDVVIKKDCKFKSATIKTVDKSAKHKLIIAIVLCFIFFLGEIIGGIMARSLAILTDSAHLFGDLSSFVISLTALHLSARQPSKTMNFGWDRVEILGALFSVLLIWIVTGILVYVAVLRIIHPNFSIEADIMLIMSGIGVIINVILTVVLHPHSHSHGHSHTETIVPESDDLLLSRNSLSADNLELTKPKNIKVENINLRAAFIHVIGDVIQSFGVLIAAFIIYFKPQWKIVDPICTFVFSFLVVLTTVFIMRDIINVLLERKPRHLNYNSVDKRISNIPGVVQIHNMRLWSITMTRTALSCHLFVDPSVDAQTVLERVYHMCIKEFHIREITIQLESSLKKNSLNCDQTN